MLRLLRITIAESRTKNVIEDAEYDFSANRVSANRKDTEKLTRNITEETKTNKVNASAQ